MCVVKKPEEFWFNNQLLIVDPCHRNGVILCKRYHAEFVGPGAAVGGIFDQDCQFVILVGDVSLIPPESADERKRGCLIRRQWAQLSRQIISNATPVQRVQNLLNQFVGFFGADMICRMLNERFNLLVEAFALMLGVLSHTVEIVFRDWLERQFGSAHDSI